MKWEDTKHCIFVADDDPDERFLIEKAVQDSGLTTELQFSSDGQVLLDQLNENSKSDVARSTDLPSLILLDLNMPRLDGRETLRLLRADSKFKSIPILILSNSRNPDDVTGSYLDGASSFFTKPPDYHGLVELMGMLKNYWFQTAKLPTQT